MRYMQPFIVHSAHWLVSHRKFNRHTIIKSVSKFDWGNEGYLRDFLMKTLFFLPNMSEVLRALESFRIIRLSMAFSAQANLKTPQMDPSSHNRPIGLISPLSSYGQVFPSHLVEDHYVWGMCPSPFLCFSLFLMSLDNNVVWYSFSLMCVREFVSLWWQAQKFHKEVRCGVDSLTSL